MLICLCSLKLKKKQEEYQNEQEEINDYVLSKYKGCDDTEDKVFILSCFEFSDKVQYARDL